MNTEKAQEIINRTDLSDSEKVGMLMEKYALSPKSPKEDKKKTALIVTTLTSTEGNYTYQVDGYYETPKKFVRHGPCEIFCHCPKCQGTSRIESKRYNNNVLMYASEYRHGCSENSKPKITREYNFDGEMTSEKKYYKNGKEKQVMHMVHNDTMCERTYIKYHKEVERVKCQYRTVKLKKSVYLREGVFRKFYPTGTIKKMGSYKNGEETGKWESWHPGGEKKRVEHFKNGESVGIIKEWYPSGQLKQKVNSLPNGVGIMYHENGQKKCDLKYKNHVAHGKWVYRDENGKKCKEVNYKKGVKHGYYKVTEKKKYINGYYYYGKKSCNWQIHYR